MHQPSYLQFRMLDGGSREASALRQVHEAQARIVCRGENLRGTLIRELPAVCHRKKLQLGQSEGDVGDVALGDVQRPEVPACRDQLRKLLVRQIGNPGETEAVEALTNVVGDSLQAAVHHLKASQLWAHRKEGLHDLVRATPQAKYLQTGVGQSLPNARSCPLRILLGHERESSNTKALQQLLRVLGADLKLENKAAARLWW
mmetsp:Transcript_136535/g.323375  ORF Transcript_136535/g.323375 Transcript_136535/m.323375 type:complete len:202 (-) Transcript_136535:468-1073(-)